MFYWLSTTPSPSFHHRTSHLHEPPFYPGIDVFYFLIFIICSLFILYYLLLLSMFVIIICMLVNFNLSPILYVIFLFNVKRLILLYLRFVVFFITF